MSEKSKNSPLSQAESEKLEARRRLLKLGGAGLPMVLTLKASATEVLVSQLQCVIRLPSRMRILVDSDGAAWVGSRRIEKHRTKGFKIADIQRFKQEADYVFPSGSVPNQYVPTACPPSYGGGDDDDDNGGGWGDDDGHGGWGYSDGNGSGYSNSSWGDDDDGCDDDSGWGGGGGDGWDSATIELDHMLQASLPSNADGMTGSYGGSGDDDNGGWGDDDDCEPEYTDCGYNYYTLRRNTNITPADYLSGSSWNPSGTEGLFIALSLTYANSYGNQGAWPGISCIVSILNYLGQN